MKINIDKLHTTPISYLDKRPKAILDAFESKYGC